VNSTSYSKADIKRLTGVSNAQFTRWAEIGLIPAHGAPAAGKGSERRFSLRGVFYFALAANLHRRAG
jgi:hypothetical protein